MAVTNLDELVRALRKADASLGPRLRTVHKRIADLGEQWAQWEAASGGGRGSRGRMRQATRSAIKGRATQTAARIGVSGYSERTAFAPAAFWGAKRRTGWFADPAKYGRYDSQFDPWVGKKWETAVAGEGPYVINDALAKHRPEILDEYKELILDVTAEAFPK